METTEHHGGYQKPETENHGGTTWGTASHQDRYGGRQRPKKQFRPPALSLRPSPRVGMGKEEGAGQHCESGKEPADSSRVGNRQPDL